MCDNKDLLTALSVLADETVDGRIISQAIGYISSLRDECSQLKHERDMVILSKINEWIALDNKCKRINTKILRNVSWKSNLIKEMNQIEDFLRIHYNYNILNNEGNINFPGFKGVMEK